MDCIPNLNPALEKPAVLFGIADDRKRKEKKIFSVCVSSQFRERKGQLYTNVIDPILMQPGIVSARPALLAEHGDTSRWRQLLSPGNLQRHWQIQRSAGLSGSASDLSIYFSR